MDPNETVALLRQYAYDATQGAPEAWLEEAPELFLALDDWMVRGGFLPRPWNPHSGGR